MSGTALALADADATATSRPGDDELDVSVPASGDFVIAPSADPVIGFVRRRDVPPASAQEYVLWRLGGRPLARPLVLKVEDDEGAPIVSSETLRIWGTGNDKFSAFQDFTQTFFAVLASYDATPPQELTGDGEHYRNQLRSFFSQ